MAGFLDAQSRVVDMVLTSLGKSLLMAGDLHFSYWIPFDDEVDYNPPSPQPRTGQTVAQRAQELTESPLVREATAGYSRTNFVEDDTTNVFRPMYSGPSGMGQTMALPQMVLNRPVGDIVGGEFQPVMDVQLPDFLPALLGGINPVTYKPLAVSVTQQKVTDTIASGTAQSTYRRYDASQESVDVTYSTGSYPAEQQLEGFLVTVFVSSALKTDELGQVQGGYQEIVHNRDSAGEIVYRNDLNLKVTP